MKKTVLSILACLFVVAMSRGQQTPSQIMAQGAAFQALSERDLIISQNTLLSIIAYGAVMSPSALMATGAAFQALSDHDLRVAQTLLLNQLGTNIASVVVNAFTTQATNISLTYVNSKSISSTVVYTNAALLGYGAFITNTAGSASAPAVAIKLSGSKLDGLTIVNTCDTNLCSAGIGIGGANQVAAGSKFEVHDLTVIGDSYGGFLYSSNAFGSDWYDCRFLANYFPFNAGTGTNRFWNCLFSAEQPSGFSYNLLSGITYQSYAFAADGFHGPNTASTNYFWSCVFKCKNVQGANASDQGALAYGFEVEFHSQNYLYGCVIDVADLSGIEDTAYCIDFIENNERLELNGCTLYWGGATNDNKVAVISGDGTNVLVLNNTFYYPQTNGVIVDNQATAGNAVYVSGGNWIPANFTHPELVHWVGPKGAAVNVTNSFIINTNFVQGFIYTNFYGAPINVSVNVRATTAAAVGGGDAMMDIQEPAGTLRKRIGIGAGVTMLATTNNYDMSWVVPVNGTYAITNTITAGAGYAVSVNGGQIFVY